MSRSSLYVIDQNFNGIKSKEYSNSWLFSPVVWDILLDKYMHDEIQTPYGHKKSLIGIDGDILQRQLNEIINDCDNTADRICWELSMQQIFFSQDKTIVDQAIKDFLANNLKFDLSDDGISPLEREHIIERFNQMADDVLAIDQIMYPNFVFKGTSVDDEVERWFSEYDEEKDDGTENPKSLRDWDTVLAEFVKIEDGNLSFMSNVEFTTPNR